MKKYLKFLPLLVLVFVVMSANAQKEEKFGHINTEQLLSKMPGQDSAQVELEKYARRLETQFVSMQNEFQQKYQEYLEDEDEYSELIRQSKQRELSSLQERITEFQESAHQDLMQKEEQLLSPIINEANEAIQKVAEEHNYTYVFDTSTGALLYSDPGDDLMSLVLEELGLD